MHDDMYLSRMTRLFDLIKGSSDRMVFFNYVILEVGNIRQKKRVWYRKRDRNEVIKRERGRERERKRERVREERGREREVDHACRRIKDPDCEIQSDRQREVQTARGTERETDHLTFILGQQGLNSLAPFKGLNTPLSKHQ